MLAILASIKFAFMRFVYYPVKDHPRAILGVVAACSIVLVLVLAQRSCNKPPKLNEAEIQQGEQAVKDRNDKQLKEILANSDVREAQIDSNIKQAEEVRRQAVANYSDMTTDQLAAELEKRK